jgi:hypothetical protein
LVCVVGEKADRVLRRELDVLRQAARECHGRHRALDALLAGDLELVLEVDVARGQKGVDAVQRRVLDGLVAAADVLLRGARQT